MASRERGPRRTLVEHREALRYGSCPLGLIASWHVRSRVWATGATNRRPWRPYAPSPGQRLVSPRPPPGTPAPERRALPTLLALAYIREDGRWVPALGTMVLVRRSDGWASD